MELLLKRDVLGPTHTAGELVIDGAWECFTLEDRYRPPPEPKVPKATCIPCGRYRVRITHSPRFGVPMPLVEAVPGFQGVRIHTGNDVDDTEGCPIVGQTRDGPRVLKSRAAYDALFEKLSAAELRGEECWLTVQLGEGVCT